ncbi:hypothetical protein GGH15_004239 [Coemansia sp. RSA 562]|nr:hypothetical protein GGH15_004239 [Coemansia sp. RSA 562]
MKYTQLELRLKTKDNIIGRIQNIWFIASGVLATLFNYYWHGPEVHAWDLRFLIIRNILRQYFAKSLPHTMSNDTSPTIDFEFIADYIAMNNLPNRPLQPSIGYNQEHNIEFNSKNCVEYNVPHYGLSSDKLNQMAELDKQLAQTGHPRSISCQVLVSTQSEFANCDPNCVLGMGPLDPDERIVLYFHGGAYCVGERSLTHMHVFAHISRTTGLRVFSPNYRLAPRHGFPSQLHDCFMAYKHVLGRGFKPQNIVLAGDSAGGALVVGVLLLLRDMKCTSPLAAVLVSPWVDATCSGDSWTRNQQYDYLPALPLTDPFHPTRMFYDAGRKFSPAMLKELQCPLVSPVFGTDLKGMPPMLVQMGRNELLHDDIEKFVAKVKHDNKDGCVRLETYEHMPHVFVLFDFADAAQKAFSSIGSFVREHN